MPKKSRHERISRLVLLTGLLTLCVAWLLGSSAIRRTSAQNPFDFKNFEAPQVHPLAITPDGTRLLATNTPNGTLSVFHVTGNSLTLLAEIPVGLEPVSVAARNNGEAWVTNWLSDSVPLGAGRRMSIDREVNGILDGDQLAQPNALDSAQFFVWQHYVDFLNRDPDPGWPRFLE